MGGRKYAARRHDATLHGHSHLTGRLTKFLSCFVGQVAQLVEQRTENPRVGSSILPLATCTATTSRVARRAAVSTVCQSGFAARSACASAAMRTRAIGGRTA